ncbi:MAG: hypothetical protein P1P76_09275 [Anaerolineales bacterium]|nr:hypothetical protein [Anaerolineales bacterium]
MKSTRLIPILLFGTIFLAACGQAVTPAQEVVAEPTKIEPTVEPTSKSEQTDEEKSMDSVIELMYSPGDVIGGTRTVKAFKTGDDVRWIMPGLRELDADIFGTPDQPLGFEPDVGLPLEARLTTEDGSAYTTTAGPNPFSDKAVEISGDFSLKAVDATLVDGPNSEDQVEFTASFTGPDGKEYGLELLKVIPKGPDHPFFGGVATNVIQHGATGIGTKLMPGAYTPLAFWGVAELTVDGEVVASNRLLHAMITSNVRDENYELVFDEGIDNSKVHLHVILPNVEVTPDGPQESPVPTGFELPNGAEQPFFHIMFEDIGIESAKIVNTFSGAREITEEISFQPGNLAGGPIFVEVNNGGDDVRWIMPGLRELDADIFGTPDQPLGFEPDVGLPLEARLTTEDGSAYTTTAGPNPFSDKAVEISGDFSLKAVDATLVDGPNSEDQVEFTASFTGPDGKEYGLELLKVIPKGPDHPFFGGVATNVIQHGATGIGTKLMPGAYTPLAFWGVAELTVDGEVVASNRLLHAMITSNVRDENYELVFDEGIDNSKVHLHVILPNVEVTPDGPQESPVPTGFELPNGAEQPFFHIMFEDLDVSPFRIVQHGS